MAKITKQLKYAAFDWDDEKKEFNVWVFDGEGGMDRISLNKTYAFAFVRFVLRIAQRNWFRRKK